MNIPFSLPSKYKMNHYDISFLTGTTGSGKSYATKLIARKYDRLIIWDSGKEYWVKQDENRRLTNQAQHNFDGTRNMNNILAESPNHLRKLMRNVLREKEQRKKHRIVLRPDDIGDIELFESYMVVIQEFIETYGLGWFLIIEEISDITNPNYTPPILKSMLRRHRHLELGIAFITQRPSGTSTWLKSQAKHIFVFQLTLTHDLKAVNDWIGQFTDTEGKKIMRVPISPVFLKKRNFILMNVRNINQIYIIEDIRKLIPTAQKIINTQEKVAKEIQTTKLSESIRRIKELFNNDE